MCIGHMQQVDDIPPPAALGGGGSADGAASSILALEAVDIGIAGTTGRGEDVADVALVAEVLVETSEKGSCVWSSKSALWD